MFTNFGIALVLTISFKAELITLVNCLRAGHDTVASVTNLVALICVTCECHVSIICFLGTSWYSMRADHVTVSIVTTLLALDSITFHCYPSKKPYISELSTLFSFTRASHSTLCILTNLDTSFCIAGHRFTRSKIAHLSTKSWHYTWWTVHVTLTKRTLLLAYVSVTFHICATFPCLLCTVVGTPPWNKTAYKHLLHKSVHSLTFACIWQRSYHM